MNSEIKSVTPTNDHKLYPLYPIKNEHDYEIAIDALNHLMDLGGADENHPLARLVTALGIFIESYEQHLSAS